MNEPGQPIGLTQQEVIDWVTKYKWYLIAGGVALVALFLLMGKK